jgi:hypothetical protein
MGREGADCQGREVDSHDAYCCQASKIIQVIKPF